jgi:hypothetical protein
MFPALLIFVSDHETTTYVVSTKNFSIFPSISVSIKLSLSFYTDIYFSIICNTSLPHAFFHHLIL